MMPYYRIILMFLCLLLLGGCQKSPGLKALFGKRLAVVSIRLDVRLLNEAELADIGFGDIDFNPSDAQIESQDLVFFMGFLDRLFSGVNSIGALQLVSPMTFRGNPVFLQLPQNPVFQNELIVPPSRPVVYDDVLRARLLAEGLGVDAISELVLRFYTTYEYEGGISEQRIHAVLSLDAVDRDGVRYFGEIEGVSESFLVDETVSDFDVEFSGGWGEYYLDALVDLRVRALKYFRVSES